jgi:hypothetical protein
VNTDSSPQKKGRLKERTWATVRVHRRRDF